MRRSTMTLIVAVALVAATPVHGQQSASAMRRDAEKLLRETPVPASDRCHIGISFAEGWLITHVSKRGSPLKAGMRIVSVNGVTIVSGKQLGDIFSNSEPNAEFTFEVKEDATASYIKVKCGSHNAYLNDYLDVHRAKARGSFRKCAEAGEYFARTYVEDSAQYYARNECAFRDGELSLQQWPLVTTRYTRMLIDENRLNTSALQDIKKYILSNEKFFSDLSQYSLFNSLVREADIAISYNSERIGGGAPRTEPVSQASLTPNGRICAGYGFSVGTTAFAQCLMDLDAAQRQAEAQQQQYQLQIQQYQQQAAAHEAQATAIKRERDRQRWETLARIGAGMANSQSPTFLGGLNDGLAAGAGLPPRPPPTPTPPLFQNYTIRTPDGTQVNCIYSSAFRSMTCH